MKILNKNVFVCVAACALFSACTMYDTFDEDLLPGAVAEEPSSSSVEKTSDVSSLSETPESSSSVKMFESFKDTRDGQVYKIAAIGTHQWFARNLNYNAGDGLSYCYDSDKDNCEKYGRLYMGNSSAFIKNLCPKGTHVSTQNDWETLFKYFKGASTDSVAVFLKATEGWSDFEGKQYAANDKSGLAMLPGGFFHLDEFSNVGEIGLWWTSTMPDPDFPYSYTTFQLSYANDDVSMLSHEFEEYALSVRCVIDE